MKLISYQRVSSRKQNENGDSLREQEQAIQTYCKLYGHEIVYSAYDVASGKSRKSRPAFEECIEMLEHGIAEGIICFDLSRISRSLADLSKMIEKYFSKTLSLVSVKEQVNTKDPASKLMLHVMASFNQYQREQTASRTKDAIQYRKKAGKVCGMAPIGFMANEAGELIKNKKEQQLIRKIRKLRKQGLSWGKTAKELTKAGFITRRGTNYTAQAVFKVWKATN